MMEKLRLWWTWHGQTAGLVLAGAAVLCLIVLVWPRGPGGQVEGRVASFGRSESETGSALYALVEVDGGTRQVWLKGDHRCQVGSRMTLITQPRVWGKGYAAPLGCRPFPPGLSSRKAGAPPPG
ncbi:MAG: hypothetical protein QM608_17750 [Caulobacter sp.]